MAEARVYTNNTGEGSDLLHQAFHHAIKEEDHLDNLLRSLTSENDSSMPLTTEQLAHLGISLTINDSELQEQQQQHQHHGQHQATEIEQQQIRTHSIQYHQESSLVHQEQYQEQCQLNFSLECKGTETQQQSFLNDFAQDKSETTVINLNKWLVQPSQNQNQISLLREEVQEPQQNKENQQREPLQSNIILEVLSPEQQDIVNQQIDVTKEPNISYSLKTQYNDSIVQTPLPFTIGPSNTQVVGKTKSQKDESILPSRDYIMKPVKQVYSPVKNVRVVPNTAKLLSPQTSQNSVLLCKATTVNPGSPQIIKAVSIGGQFLTTSVPVHVINSSPIFTKTMSVTNSNHMVNGSLNTTSTSTQKMFFKAPVQQTTKTRIGQLNNKNVQFTAPTTKVKTNGTLVNASILTNAINKQNATPIIKCQNRPIKSAFIKSQMTNIPIILRTTPVVNTGTLKNSSPPTSLIRNHTSTPISILKPKIKAANNSQIKQVEQNAYFIQANSLIKPTEVSNRNKPLISAKMKQNVNSLLTSLQKKVVPLVIAEKQEVSGVNKQLQKRQILSQAQLKYLSETLRQKNQNMIIKETSLSQFNNKKNQAQITNNQKHQAQVINNQKNHIQLINSKNQSNKEYTVFTLVVNNNDVNGSNSSSKKGKRGRPKKIDLPIPTIPVSSNEEQQSQQQQQPQQQQQLLQDEAKEERKIIVARTRSGRVSRPPKHMVEDYKHLHRTDFTQPDLDDSNGGYIDYNANGSGVKPEELERNPPTELLTGLVLPKRKISDQFKCPTCAKTYLGRIKMAKHFELNPDHGSSDQLLLPSVEYEHQDPLKRKGKKRGMHVYTPEQKAKRRRTTLRDSINACTTEEIAEVAGEKITSSMSVFDFIVKKSGNNVRSFLMELKELGESLRQKVSTMLSVANNEEKHNDDVVDLNDEVLCDILALNSGFYKINKPFCEETKTDDGQERKLTETSEVDSSEELFQGLPKMEIENVNQTIIENANQMEIENVNQVKIENVNQMKIENVNKLKMETVERAFIKLEPTQDGGFIKLGNGIIGSFHQDIGDLGKLQNNTFQCVSDGTTGGFNETNGFKKLEPEIMTQPKLQLPYGNNIMNDRSSQINQENSIQITTNGNGHNHNGSSNIFINTEVNYDHINFLNATTINNNLMIIDRLVDSISMGQEIGSEKLKMVKDNENELDTSLLQGNNNLHPQIDFDDFSEEFNRNTRS